MVADGSVYVDGHRLSCWEWKLICISVTRWYIKAGKIIEDIIYGDTISCCYCCAGIYAARGHCQMLMSDWSEVDTDAVTVVTAVRGNL